MFYRDLEVAGHPRRQPERLLVGLLHPLLFFFEAREGFVRIGVQRGDGHQPHELQPVGGRRGGTQLVDRIRTADVHTAPRLVAVQAELEVDPQRLGPAALPQRFACGPVQRSDHPGAVDRMRRVRPAGDRPRFVALNPPDHVPANRLSAQHGTDFRAFIRRFLFAGFAKFQTP